MMSSEAHIGGSWVAGQARHRRAIDDAEGLGFARTHVHSGHEQFACAFYDGLDEVGKSPFEGAARK